MYNDMNEQLIVHEGLAILTRDTMFGWPNFRERSQFANVALGVFGLTKITLFLERIYHVDETLERPTRRYRH
jgi:hypothetical protein